MSYLYDELREYCGEDHYPFHMPGHKRRLGELVNPFSIDITEIDGFDNLHHAEGILAEAQKRAALLYGSEESYFLINGSTCGILSAIGACAPTGTLLMARNCHKAAYHAVFLNRLKAGYLYPDQRKGGINGPIRAEDVRRGLEQDPQIRAVFLTSPTYDGVVSDIKEIADVAHEFQRPLIVDAAHGAHFGMHPDFPENAVRQGADLVIHSLHKTLPSLTQTALLHVNGNLVDRGKLRKMLNIYQSSSPSYILMASMDECIRLLQARGDRLFEDFAARLRRFRESVQDLRMIQLIDTEDPSKLLISAVDGGLTGLDLDRILREKYHLEMEMAAGGYVLALTSVGDDEEGLQRLARALREMDEMLCEQARADALGGRSGQEKEYAADEDCSQKQEDIKGGRGNQKEADVSDENGAAGEGRNEICMTIFEAENRPQRRILLEQCAGCISGEYIYLYPPGIPMVVPGERISEGLLEQMLYYRDGGYALQGMEDYGMEYIRCVEE